ncbi:hypothetical protein [Actinoplanes sp. NPDC049802]|uniref:hypothetical protein n=1 Tax=Actinoplanes sp. NPDC049802 TaxID=3154742 RepID=UPI0033F924AB
MTFPRFLTGAVCAAVLAATPATAAPPPGELELHYLGDLAGPALVADSSGKNLHGTVVTGGGGTITPVDGFLRFPGGSCTAAPCPQAIIRPASSVTLVPGDQGEGLSCTAPPSASPRRPHRRPG